MSIQIPKSAFISSRMAATREANISKAKKRHLGYISLATAASAATAAAVTAKSDKIKEFFQPLTEKLKGFSKQSDAKETVKEAAQTIKDGAEETLNNAASAAKEAAETVKEEVKKINIKEKVTAVKDKIGNTAGMAKDKAKELTGKFKETGFSKKLSSIPKPVKAAVAAAAVTAAIGTIISKAVIAKKDAAGDYNYPSSKSGLFIRG